jgi:valyl-tRNA synthetase
MLDERLLKPYDPKTTEDKIYKLWEESGFFNPDKCVAKGATDKNAEPFSIILPPPNVTGMLHIGHAFEDAIQDTMVRFARLQGKRTLWIPGTDHAAIATQTKVEKLLEKEGIRKKDLGREEFLNRVNKFAKESHDTIIRQLKKLGVSLDWSREAFTLDENRSLAVRTAFKQMYDDGLIYRGNRIVNWDPKGQTVISDDEIVYQEQKAKFYTFRYGPFEIGTARPETKFGDKYVVMHPEDERYKKWEHGQKLTLEWINGPIEATIIKDPMIDMEFGTGVMTITPWHSHEDFALAEKYKLEKEQIIDQYGKLLPIAEEFAGMKIAEAREKIVEKLKAKGLLVSVDENYTNRVATAERSGGMIEPQIMKQWFIDVNKKIPNRGNKSLKELMLEPVREEKIKILPDHFEKVYFNWIENLRDWCISRQLWYGHRIPVWYRENEIYCGIEAPKGDAWIQEEDTLDTWFSSGLWTFSTLGWPEKTEDLKTYHPTTTLITGYELIFFWMARMTLMSQYLLGEIPFKTVYFHGIVRDLSGKKVSKSSGNNIDPIDVIREYGADALRMALIVGVGPGNDTKLDLNKVKAYKHFANKLWNITRFVLDNTKDLKYDPEFENYTETDQTLRKERHDLLTDITEDMKAYRFYLASEKIYHYTWHSLADKILEDSKKILEQGNEKEKESRQQFLLHTLRKIVICLHPFMPFVTEEIWSMLPVRNATHNVAGGTIKDNNLLMVARWPIE